MMGFMNANVSTTLFLLDCRRLKNKKFFMPQMKNSIRLKCESSKLESRLLGKDNQTRISQNVKKLIDRYTINDTWIYEPVQVKEGSYVLKIKEKGKITMYCKVACNDSFYDLAKCEKDCYEYLIQHRISNLVDYVFAGPVSESEYVILSKALKNKAFISLHKTYNKLMEEIVDISKKTSKTVLFEESDFYKQLKYLKDNIESFPDKELGNSLLKYIDKYILDYSGSYVTYSYYYGDCRVENVAYDKGNLTWYDFQRGKQTYPLNMDKYHLICLYVDLNSDILKKRLKTFPWYNEKEFAEFMLDFFCRFISTNEERNRKHMEWFLKSYRNLWYSLVE